MRPRYLSHQDEKTRSNLIVFEDISKIYFKEAYPSIQCKETFVSQRRNASQILKSLKWFLRFNQDQTKSEKKTFVGLIFRISCVDEAHKCLPTSVLTLFDVTSTIGIRKHHYFILDKEFIEKIYHMKKIKMELIRKKIANNKTSMLLPL